MGYSADDVHSKVALDGLETTGRGRAVTGCSYAGVVDENLEAAEVHVDSTGSGGMVVESSRSIGT